MHLLIIANIITLHVHPNHSTTPSSAIKHEEIRYRGLPRTQRLQNILAQHPTNHRTHRRKLVARRRGEVSTDHGISITTVSSKGTGTRSVPRASRRELAGSHQPPLTSSWQWKATRGRHPVRQAAFRHVLFGTPKELVNSQTEAITVCIRTKYSEHSTWIELLRLPLCQSGPSMAQRHV